MSSTSEVIDKDRPTRAFCALLSGEVGEGWGSDRPSTPRISVFAQINLYLGKTPTSKEHPLKFHELSRTNVSRISYVYGYRVYSNQVVAGGVPGMKQCLCLGRML